MKNFTYYAPTRVMFGKGTEEELGKIVSGYGFHKVLIHFGGGSVKRSGLLERLEKSLAAAGVEYVEFGGVQPNPKLSLVREAIQVCVQEQADLVLAVGGGSVIDSAKCVAAGAAEPSVDPWEYLSRVKTVDKSLPVGVVLTIAASGSEMRSSCVITKEDGGLKRSFNSDLSRPLFAIMNPELTYSVSKFQTGCGTVDIMMHTLERYFGTDGEAPLTDRLAEGLLKEVIEAGRIADREPDNYEARAALMWAGSLSHNSLTGLGRDYFMTAHQIEHELSGMFDKVAHGAGLSVLFPAWCRYIYKYAIPRFCQYAVRVWNLDMNYEHPERTALAGIQATEEYFRSLGMPTRMGELGIALTDAQIEELAEKATFFGTRIMPDYIPIGKKEIIEILREAL